MITCSRKLSIDETILKFKGGLSVKHYTSKSHLPYGSDPYLIPRLGSDIYTGIVWKKNIGIRYYSNRKKTSDRV